MNVATICFLTILTTVTACDEDEDHKQSEFFYYYYDEKIYLEEDRSKVLVKLDQPYSSDIPLEDAASPAFAIESTSDNYVVMNRTFTFSVADESLRAVRDLPEVVSANYMVKGKDTWSFGYTDEFSVSTQENVSMEEFINFINANGVAIIEQSKYADNHFLLSLPKESPYTLFQMVDRFHQSNLIHHAEPNFWGATRPQ